jgi:hypothetical protein
MLHSPLSCSRAGGNVMPVADTTSENVEKLADSVIYQLIFSSDFSVVI